MSEPAAYRIDGRLVSAQAFYAAACNPARSIAVEACAGAGKTWMLVARIVRALLDGTPAQDILAITFTKKAAAEMRGRLNSELGRCAGLSDADRIAALRSWGLDEAEAVRRAPELQSLQARVQAQGRQVQLRTFHSWFSALLRGAPLAVLQELGLPLRYELLEDDQRAMPFVWPRFYAALAEHAEDRQAFFDSVARHGRHQTLKALESALSKRVEFQLADAAGAVDRSVEPFGEVVPDLRAFERPELALAGEAVRRRWLERARALGAEKNKTPQKAAQAVVDAFAGDDQDLVGRLEALRKAFFVATEDRLHTHLLKYPDALAAEAELQTLCKARAQHGAWQHQQRMARLTRVLLDCHAALKRERGWVDMNDLESAARRLLGDPTLSGWLQQRLDARVSHLLIDEFQDTNPLQWQALYGWLSAYAGAGAGDPPRVFLVGDPKQSIYRFRRAEPEVFKAAQAFVVGALGGALLSCDHTRRCAPAVVEALNAVMQEAVQGGEYTGYRSHTTHSTEAGAVLALPAIERPARDAVSPDGDEPVWRDSLAQPKVLPDDEGSADREAAQVADWLAQQIAGGASADSFMVLARKRNRLRRVHEALRERGVAGEAPGEAELIESPAVQDLVALLDALVSPRHHLSLARALKSPLFGWSDADLVALASAVRAAGEGQAQPPGWWDVLPTTHPATAEMLALYRGWLEQLPPHDALSAIYEHGDVLANFARAVPASERGTTLAALRDLLAQSLAQDGGRFLTPYRFVRALKAGGTPASGAHQPGAVRLLTIHGAKGLEASTVLLLDTDSPPQSADSMGVLVDWPAEAAAPQRFVFVASEKTPPVCAQDLLLAEQQARAVEELNALYVAITRAETRLVVSSFVPHRAPGRSWWSRLHPRSEALQAPVPVQPGKAGDPVFRLRELPTLDPSRRRCSPVVATEPTADEGTRIGRALHRLLQWRPTPTGGFEWRDEHLRAVAREFDLTPAACELALGMAKRMVSGPAAWAWSAEQLLQWGNEVEIWHEGSLLRMDRLVRRRDSGHWWVLDYKSALRPEQQLELREQMARYRRALLQARPGETVRLAFINAVGEWIELESHEH